MAKTKTANEGVEIADPISDASYDLEQNILAALNATDENVKFHLSVHKVNQNNAKEIRIGVFAPSDNMDALLDDIAVKKGEGTYRFRLYRNNVICKQTDLELTPPLSFQPQSQVSQNDVASAIASALKGPMDMIASLVTKIGDRQPAERSDITDLVNALGALDTMRGRNAPSQSPLLGAKEILDLVKQGMELGKEASGGDGGETGWMGLVSKLLDKIDLEKLAATYAAPVATQPAQLGSPRAETAPSNQAAGEPTPIKTQVLSPEQQLAGMLRQNIRYLVQRAQANSDPGLYADWTVDNIPMEVLQGIVNAPNAIEILQQIDPNVGAHADWFMEVLENVRTILTEDAKEAQSQETPSDKANAQSVPTEATTGSQAGP